MPRSYASDLLVDDFDLDSERVAGRPYRPARRRSDLFMVVVAAVASAGVLFNALALQQGRQGSSAPKPAAAPGEIRKVPISAATPPATPVVAPMASPAASSAPVSPGPVVTAPAIAAPLPPPKPAVPPRAAASAPAQPAPVASVPAPATNLSALLPPGEVPVSPRVVEIQKALARLGYGPIRIDGRTGSATTEAIERFERDRRLPVTGNVSDRLIRELNAVAGLSIQ